jgi:uncharacterized protein (TIGR03435 family)
MRVFTGPAALGCITAALAMAQQPAFDAASIKVVQLASHPVFGSSGGPGTADPGRVHLCCVGMYSLLMRAYDVDLDQIVGPPWIMDNMGPNLYQVDATMPPDTTKTQFQFMLRNLLVERFHLAVHLEKRNFPGYELVVAEGGPKVTESRPNPSVAIPDTPQMPKRSADGTLILPPGPQLFTGLGRGMVIVQAQEKSVGDLVKGMGRLIADSLGENPNDFASRKPRIADKTGLTGKYDFTLRFSCDSCQSVPVNGAFAGPPGASESPNEVPNIFVALQRQLGLKLVKVKDLTSDVVVVDHADKTPTAN